MACCSERVVEALTSGAAVNLSVQMASPEPEPLCIGNAGRSRAAESCLEQGAASRPGSRRAGEKGRCVHNGAPPRPLGDNGVLGDQR